MKRQFPPPAVVALAMSFAIVAPVQGKRLPATGSPASTLIVFCDCATAAKRAHIKRKIERAGGRIVYSYNHMNGFAVAAERAGGAAGLERKLRRISGVSSVVPDEMIRLAPPGHPQ